MRYLPISIKKEGLQAYLDRTKVTHDGFGYKRFVKEYEKGQNSSALARMFSVSRNTMLKWIKVHEAEKTRENHETAVESLKD